MAKQKARAHRFQRCTYRENKNDLWEVGIAKLQPDMAFGQTEIQFVVDANGRKLESYWDCRLVEVSFDNVFVAMELPVLDPLADDVTG